MPPSKPRPIFDGATLSPRLKPKPGDDIAVSEPIGKRAAAGGAEVPRAYKHAAGKSSTYSPQVVDMIYHMSREGDFGDEQVGQFVAAKLAAERDLPRGAPPLTWDQLVFLSANLTRLVIDPYRERCESRVSIGVERAKPLELAWPVVFGGIDLGRLPGWLAAHFAIVARTLGTAVTIDAASSLALRTDVPRIVTVDAMAPIPSLADPAAVEISVPDATQFGAPALAEAVASIRRETDGQIPVGIVAPAFNAPFVVDQTIDLGVDFYVPDANWTTELRPQTALPELVSAPSIHVLADTVERLRHHRKEEVVGVLYRGGIRGGADAGKALCLGATAVSLGLSALIGVGFKVTQIDDEAKLLAQLDDEPDNGERIETHLANFAKSVNVEVTMLARACGKSSVSNMEPEDLRSLTSDVSAATGVPLVGKDYNFRR